MTRRAVMQAIRAMLEDAADEWELEPNALVQEFARRIKNRRGWRFSDEEAYRRLRQILNGNAGRYLDPDEIGLAIDLTGKDYVSAIFQRRCLRAQDRIEEEGPPTRKALRPMRVVRRREGRAVG